MYRAVKVGLVLTLLFMVVLLSQPGVVVADSGKKLGPVSGEKLVFNVRWGVVPSGTAVMNFNRVGESGYRLESSLKSYGAMDFFFPIKDDFIVTGFESKNQLFADVYTKKQNENGKKRTIKFHFDRPNNKVVFSRNEESREIPVEGAINDYMSAVYSVRKRDIKPGDSFKTTIVLEKETLYEANIWTEKREGLATPVGYLKTIPISIVVPKSRHFKNRGDFVFWFTDDERHMLAKIKINAGVGSISMDLVEYDDGRGGSSRDLESEDDN
ncbi:MAG: DUF3108 domain-containing protein [Magnetococcales bacterium]|nr:DUF3108 domain-containing protein [Magnetococcales bacterium]